MAQSKYLDQAGLAVLWAKIKNLIGDDTANPNQTVSTPTTGFPANAEVCFQGFGEVEVSAATTGTSIMVGTQTRFGKNIIYGDSGVTIPIPSESAATYEHASASTGGVKQLNFGSEFQIPIIVSDTYGKITNSSVTATFKLPADSNTNQKVKSGNVTFGDSAIVALSGDGIVQLNATASTKNQIDFTHKKYSTTTTNRTFGESTDRTLVSGGNFKIPYLVVDEYGHVSASTKDVKITIPASNNYSLTISVDSGETTEKIWDAKSGQTINFIATSGISIYTTKHDWHELIHGNIVSSQTLAIGHKTYNAKTAGESASKTLTFGGTFKIPYLVSDELGHVSDLTKEVTLTLPSPEEYSHPSYTTRTGDLYKFSVDSLGHVDSVTAMTQDLMIPYHYIPTDTATTVTLSADSTTTSISQGAVLSAITKVTIKTDERGHLYPTNGNNNNASLGIEYTTVTIPTVTWRPIKVNGTQKFASDSDTAVDFVNGTNTTVVYTSSGNKIQVNALDTWRPVKVGGVEKITSAQTAPLDITSGVNTTVRWTAAQSAISVDAWNRPVKVNGSVKLDSSTTTVLEFADSDTTTVTWTSDHKIKINAASQANTGNLIFYYPNGTGGFASNTGNTFNADYADDFDVKFSGGTNVSVTATLETKTATKNAGITYTISATDTNTWRAIKTNGTERLAPNFYSAVDFVGSGATSVDWQGTGNKVVISSRNDNTWRAIRVDGQIILDSTSTATVYNSATTVNFAGGSGISINVVDNADNGKTLYFNGITDDHVNNLIDQKLTTAIIPSGSKTAVQLPSESSSELGHMYNITTNFILSATTGGKVEMWYKGITSPQQVGSVGGTIAWINSHRVFDEPEGTYPAGSNVLCVNVGTSGSPVYKWDIVGALFDMEEYWAKNELTAMTASEINAICT